MTRPRYVNRDGEPIAQATRKAQKARKPEEPTLFPLVEDARPAILRKAAGRYLEPGLFDGGTP